MKKFAYTLALILAATQLSGAVEAPAPAAAAPPAPAAAASAPPVLELKNKSSFALDATSRNPFWPIGWKPATKQAANTAEAVGGPQILPTSFMVSSITVDEGGRFAIINGKAMTEGQVFGLQIGNQTYQITVKAIQDGQVVLMRRDEEIIVPLRRR